MCTLVFSVQSLCLDFLFCVVLRVCVGGTGYLIELQEIIPEMIKEEDRFFLNRALQTLG